MTFEQQKSFFINISRSDYIKSCSQFKTLFKKLPTDKAVKLVSEHLLFLPEFLENEGKLSVSNSVSDLLNEIFSTFPFTEEGYRSIRSKFSGYKGYPVVINNGSISAELKTLVFKENYVQKDITKYVTFLKEHLTSYNNLDAFIQATVVQNNRVKNKSDNIEDLFLRIVCGDNTTAYYRYSYSYKDDALFDSELEGCEEFFEKYKEYINFKTISSMLKYKTNTRVNTRRAAALKEVTKYLARNLTINEKVTLIGEYPEFGEVLFDNIRSLFGKIDIESDASIMRYSIIRKHMMTNYYGNYSNEDVEFSGVSIAKRSLASTIYDFFSNNQKDTINFLDSDNAIASEICKNLYGSNNRYELDFLTLDSLRRQLSDEKGAAIVSAISFDFGMNLNIFTQNRSYYSIDTDMSNGLINYLFALESDYDYLSDNYRFIPTFIDRYLSRFANPEYTAYILVKFSEHYNKQNKVSLPYGSINNKLPSGISTIAQLFLHNVSQLLKAAKSLNVFDEFRENEDYHLEEIIQNLTDLETNIDLLISI